MSVNLRTQSRQKRKWPLCRDPVGFVLDVTDDQAIDRQRPKPRHLLGHDGFQLLGWRRLLGRSKPIEVNPGRPRAQLVREGTYHRRRLIRLASKHNARRSIPDKRRFVSPCVLVGAANSLPPHQVVQRPHVSRGRPQSHSADKQTRSYAPSASWPRYAGRQPAPRAPAVHAQTPRVSTVIAVLRNYWVRA